MPMPFQQREFTFTNPDGTEFQVRRVGQSVPCGLRDAGRLHRHQGPRDRLLPVRALVGRRRRAAPDGRERQRRGPHERSGADARSSRALRRRQAAGACARRAKDRSVAGRNAATEKLDLLREALAAQPCCGRPAACRDRGGVRRALPADPVPRRPGHDHAGRGRRLLQPGRLHRLRQQRLGARLLPDVSDGKLTYTNVVTAYYTAAHNRAYYTDPAIPYGTRARELIVEALDAPGGVGLRLRPAQQRRRRLRLRAERLLRRVQRSTTGREGLWPHSWALAAPYRGRRRQEVQRLPDHRHGRRS